MLKIRDKTHFLTKNKALDCVKDKVSWRLLSVNQEHNAKTKQERKQVLGKKTVNEKASHEKLTKVERRKKYGELKYRMKNVWTTEMESSTDETGKDGKPMNEAP